MKLTPSQDPRNRSTKKQKKPQKAVFYLKRNSIYKLIPFQIKNNL